MHIDTAKLLEHARARGFAVGAFNIYNLEGATAVIEAAEEMQSPVIVQLLPSALDIGGSPLIAMCLEIAKKSAVPVSVHLDHCSSSERIDFALQAGLHSIMADGSALLYEENIHFTRGIVARASRLQGSVEAELGKLTGEEDGLTIAQYEEKLTDPDQAADFVAHTGVSALAVCIGNVHGAYHQPPDLDFTRLARIARQVSIPLVLHGTSGLPDQMIARAIDHGVAKFNVNTEVRNAYINALQESFATSSQVELVQLMRKSIDAMKAQVQSKLQLFCSADKASIF